MVLAAVAVSLAVSVAGAQPARANGDGSPPTRLDKATASVLAEDIAFIDGADLTVELPRCIRIPGDPLRVDCVIEFINSERSARVFAIVVRGERVYADAYSARVRRHDTKANSIRISPPDFGQR